MITTITENEGIYIENITTVKTNPKDVYVAITGDQCAVTNIKIT